MGEKRLRQHGVRMYVEILQGHMYATEREPDVAGDVTWQWEEITIHFGDWTNRLEFYKSGTACLDCVIT